MVKDFFLFLFLLLLFTYGLFMIFGAMRNWRSFLNSYKSIDLIKLFGDFGRILYVILGLIICCVAIFLFLKKLGFSTAL